MYIDPNTGGVLFQMLAVALAVFSGVFLAFSSKIRAAIAKYRRRHIQDQNPQENDKE